MLNISQVSSDSSQYTDDGRTAAAETTAASVPSFPRRELLENIREQTQERSVREIRAEMAHRIATAADDGSDSSAANDDSAAGGESVSSLPSDGRSVKEIRAEREATANVGGGGSQAGVSISTGTGSAGMPPLGSRHSSSTEKNVVPNEQDRKRVFGCLACVLGNRPFLPEELEEEGATETSWDVVPDYETMEKERETSRLRNKNGAETQVWVSDDEDDNGSLLVDFPSYGDNDDENDEENIENNDDQPIRASTLPEQFTNFSNHSTSSFRRSPSPPSISSRSFRRRPKLNSKRSSQHQCRERHIRRYHEFNVDVLQRCTALLMLDPSNARAFAPLLSIRGGHPRQQDNHGSNHEPSSVNGSPGCGLQKNASSSDIGDRSFYQSASSDNETTPPCGTSGSMDAGSGTARLRSKFSFSNEAQTRVSGASFSLPPDIFVPFLKELSDGSGFCCVAMLLLKYLLSSKEGYDARVRHVFKRLAVEIFSYEIRKDKTFFNQVCNNGLGPSRTLNDISIDKALRQFEALESAISEKLMILSNTEKEENNGKGRSTGSMMASNPSSRKEKFIRAAKIGSAGVLAGTIFAMTGGLAAPGIASGISLIAGSAAVTTGAAITFLTSAAAVSTIFGVGGGGLAAYKMNRRTVGVTQFDFTKETKGSELYSIACLSGWLRDRHDFQRPWGVKPQGLPALELLQRFYSIHKPENVPRCSRILENWRGDERGLWNELRSKYGRDPSDLLPLLGPTQKTGLTFEQDQILIDLLVSLGHERLEPQKDKEEEWNLSPSPLLSTQSQHSINSSFLISGTGGSSSTTNGANQVQSKKSGLPKQVMPVWDFHSEYNGELYTVNWEPKLLLELRDCVTDVAVEIATGATRSILYQTALHSLMATITLPYALVSASHMIDGTWTLAIERADEAGVVLAQSLLRSKAGHRPIVLVGFSMGARMIYSCLKELARHQTKWEELRSSNTSKRKKKSFRNMMRSSSKNINDDEYDSATEVYFREPASIVEDAILMGCPNHFSQNSWNSCRQIVAGRLVNCYASTDLILTFLFQYRRISGIFRPVCGTNPIDVPGVENYDVSEFISSHSDYCSATKDILALVKFGRPDMALDPVGYEIETDAAVEVASSIGLG